MQHSPKYVIHADIRTSGVVERSDVVGAIYGQTEGLLGEDLDLRDLQESSKVGRIDVDIDSEGGRTFGTVTIASGLDRAETAVLAAALETIERVGPCRSTCEVIKIEDARAAKRRQIVDRATELLASFEAETLTSDRLVDEVRERVREAELTEFHGLPAGPRVADSDAIIVVEGRADVRQLLSYGVKNAIAVEGTDIPEAVARLTTERTTTAFLDGDRGGDLVLRELAQVGDIDYVAFAPSGQSVEDLDRGAVMGALRKKIPYEQVTEGTSPREAFAPTDGGTVPDSPDGAVADSGSVTDPVEYGTPSTDPSPERTDVDRTEGTESAAGSQPSPEPDPTASVEEALDAGSVDGEEGDSATTGEAETEAPAEPSEPDAPPTLADHVSAVIGDGSGNARLLDDDLETLAEAPAEEAFEAVESAEQTPESVVLDGPVSQRLLDLAAQRGVSRIVAAETGEFVKQPVNVRVHTAEEITG